MSLYFDIHFATSRHVSKPDLEFSLMSADEGTKTVVSRGKSLNLNQAVETIKAEEERYLRQIKQRVYVRCITVLNQVKETAPGTKLILLEFWV